MEFIFAEKGLFEISENKNPSKITHYTVLANCACIITYWMLGAWVELAAVPAALISITIASYMLSACVWLANYLYTVAKYIFFIRLVEESFLLIIWTWMSQLACHWLILIYIDGLSTVQKISLFKQINDYLLLTQHCTVPMLPSVVHSKIEDN